MFWLGTNLGRVLFMSFPAILPLAVAGLRRLMSAEATDVRAA
jgi:hypothetical protein